MRTITIFILIAFFASVEAQDLCLERGHVKFGRVDSAKFAWCKPYIVDEPDSSYIVYPSCYIYRYMCMRCGALVSQVGEDKKRITVWRK